MGHPFKTPEEKLRDIVKQMKAKWPSVIVTRGEISKFTGGLFSGETLNQFDCKGTGPKYRIKSNLRVAYDVDEFCRWMLDDYGLKLEELKEKAVPEILRK